MPPRVVQLASFMRPSIRQNSKVPPDSTHRWYHSGAMSQTRGLFLLPLTLLQVSALCSAEVPTSKAEARVACNALLLPEPKTAYGFAKATLVSLWYARNAARRSSEMKPQPGETETPLSTVTSMMLAIKNSTNDFVCAKRAVQPFNVKSSGDNIQTTAEFLMVIYDQHIALDQKMLNIVKNLGNLNQADFLMKMADQMSTLQMERQQRWADLVPAVTLTLGLLVDLRPTDDDGNFIPPTEINLKQGKTKRFAITKAQKQALLDWIAERFPEFSDKTPENQWTPPASAARSYLDFLNDGRKCSDE